jgi:hypothetical protein
VVERVRAANQDPCLPPLTGATYFNVAPRQSFFVLPVGASATFKADAFSLAPMSDWSLLPQDWSDSTTSYLSFSIEGATSTEAGPVVQANDGATVRITVTLTKDPGALDVGETDGALVSFSGDPDAPTAAVRGHVRRRCGGRGRHRLDGPSAQPPRGGIRCERSTIADPRMVKIPGMMT